MWRRRAPSARRNPTSERRSSTEMIITLAIPIAPTRRATAPAPRKSEVKALSAAACALRASEGRLTATDEPPRRFPPIGVGRSCQERGMT
jgi:hypothetical protein